MFYTWKYVYFHCIYEKFMWNIMLKISKNNISSTAPLNFQLKFECFNQITSINNCVEFFRTKVDVERQLLTVLSPQPKPLPNTCLILSDIQFVDNRWCMFVILNLCLICTFKELNENWYLIKMSSHIFSKFEFILS